MIESPVPTFTTEDTMDALPLDARTVNALSTAMGGLAGAIARTLTPQQGQAFQDDLARFAQARNAVGDTIAGSVLLDLASAVESFRHR